MQPWERRLRDLAQLLRNCGETYFSPDLFRQNTNQFLQTSRTITFIIQKNKGTIPDFDTWYKVNVLQPWATDPVMSWAKNSRNVIEKEGDLEMQSTLQVSVLFSYDVDDDMVLEVSRKELLQASVEQLLKAAIHRLSSSAADDAVLKIQRKWVANTLPGRELIYAFTFAYSQLHRVCRTLAAHLGSALDQSIPDPTSLDPSSNDVARVRFMKLTKPGIGRHASKRLRTVSDYKPPPELLKLKGELQSTPKPNSLVEIIAWHGRMAQLTFELHGNHIPMLTLYDKTWEPLDFLSAAFTDQAEKYLFWRNVADRAFYLKAHALVLTCESWVRDFSEHLDCSVSELPTIGEQLLVVGADSTGTHEIAAWDIARHIDANQPSLTPLAADDIHKLGQIFFTKPVIAAMMMANANC